MTKREKRKQHICWTIEDNTIGKAAEILKLHITTVRWYISKYKLQYVKDERELRREEKKKDPLIPRWVKSTTEYRGFVIRETEHFTIEGSALALGDLDTAKKCIDTYLYRTAQWG